MTTATGHGAVTWWRTSTAKVLAGCAAVLAWGGFFDQLVRTGRWFLDTGARAPYLRMEDLHTRYLEAHRVLVHAQLYKMVWPGFPAVQSDTYPPFTAYLFVPFHAIGFRATMTLWTIATVAAWSGVVAVSLYRWLGLSRPDAWVVAAVGAAPATIIVLYPFHATLLLGQMAVLVLAAIFLDLFVVPARYRGVLIGVVTAVKLLPGLFVLWFLVRKEVPAIVRAAVAFVALTALAWLLYPHASATYWLHVLPSGRDVQMAVNPRQLPVGHAFWFNGIGKVLNTSLRGMLARPPLFAGSTLAWVLVAGAVGIGGLVVGLRLVGQGRELAAFVVLSLLTVLVAPVSWNHYWVFVGLAPVLALCEWRRDRALAAAAIALACVTSANLASVQTEAFPGAPGVLVFVLRNAYTLGGLAFLAIAARSAFAAREVRAAPGVPAGVGLRAPDEAR